MTEIDILGAAKKMLKAGFNLFPASNKNKRPLGEWKKYQNTSITEKELDALYKKTHFKAFAVIGGMTSGGLCIIDFDVPGYYENWVKAVGEEVVNQFPVVITGGDGHHVYIRCPEPGRSQPLAFHPNESRKEGREIAIETRAQGGLCMAPPSLHPSGKRYRWAEGCSKKCLPITQEQFEALLDKARELDNAPLSAQQIKNEKKAKPKRRSFEKDGISIIEKYNAVHTIEEALEGCGYKKHGRSKMYVRPGGHNPTVKILEGVSYHHNTSDELCDGHSHDAFDIFCRYSHANNMTMAVRAAAQELNIEYTPLSEKKAALVKQSDGVMEKSPFKCLGYDKEFFFYLPNASNQIRSLKVSAHVKLNLMSLAPPTWWEKNFMLGRKSVDWDIAAATMFNAGYRAGRFEPRKVRGRGAWIDDGRIVVHAGDRLIVDGVENDIHEFKSQYIYESDVPMKVSLDNPLTAREAQEFMELLETLAWHKPIEAKLFGGWLFLASICGALKWRPHIWITGPRAIGKSTIINDIGASLMGTNKLMVQSVTTEAGLRAGLGFSAAPVFFDEGDTQVERDRERMGRIIEFIRSASTDGESSIVKGGLDGKPHVFTPKSMFCLGSVNTQIEQAADTSRISVLTLVKRPDQMREEAWAKISRLMPKFSDPEWTERFRARAIIMLPTLLKNITVFVNAFSAFYERRAGDQIGSMLAGAYTGFYSDKVVGFDWAKNWIDDQDWTTQSVIDSDSDEVRCLFTILESSIIVSTRSERLERTVHELISCIHDSYGMVEDDMDVSAKTAAQTLVRHGIKYDEDNEVLWISNSHKSIRKMLYKSAWQAKWRDVLTRVNGATESHAERFGAIVNRATGIPASVFLNHKDEEK